VPDWQPRPLTIRRELTTTRGQAEACENIDRFTAMFE
jgi:hypothetical protein